MKKTILHSFALIGLLFVGKVFSYSTELRGKETSELVAMANEQYYLWSEEKFKQECFCICHGDSHYFEKIHLEQLNDILHELSQRAQFVYFSELSAYCNIRGSKEDARFSFKNLCCKLVPVLQERLENLVMINAFDLTYLENKYNRYLTVAFCILG